MTRVQEEAIEREYAETLYEHDGQAKTIGQWAHVLNVDLDDLDVHLRRGCEIREAIKLTRTTKSRHSDRQRLRETERRKRLSPMKRRRVVISLHEYEGVSKTMAEWALHSGINLATMRTMLGRGATLERILNNPPVRTAKGGNLYTFRDQSKTIADWSKHTGTSVGTLNYRLRKGWSFEKAITTPVYRKS